MALNLKQKKALELLTGGQGLRFQEIAKEVGIGTTTLWQWRNEPQFKEFQDELKRLNEQRWQAAEDAAREGAIKLCKNGNQKMIEFVLKNLGYNPTQKIEQNGETVIKVSVDEEE